MQHPYFLKALDKRIDRLKSKRDRCKKKAKKITRSDGSTFWLPSRRWLYLNARLQEVYRKRREQTKQFLYTVANRLYHDYDAVGIGDYVPHGGGITRKMRRSMNNQSLNWRFKQVLCWVALRSGKQALEWEEGGSTRTCHDCVTPVKGHHLSGEQSPTSSGNGSMPNVSLATEREVKDQSMTRRPGRAMVPANRSVSQGNLDMVKARLL